MAQAMNDRASPESEPACHSQRFREGVIWNVASLAVLATSGLALNILIGTIYSPATLGVFNQVLAAYIVFSMLAGGGLNLSTLKHVAESPGDTPRVQAIVVSSLLLTIGCSTLFTVVFVLLRHIFAAWLASGGVAVGMLWIAPGLFCFGINKTLLGIVNGLHQMRAYAVFQALRYLNLLTGFGLAVLLQIPGDRLAAVFTFSEGILLLALLITLRRYWWPATLTDWRAWLWPHLRFGAKGIFSGALQELNSRIDVLMLGYFLSDGTTGIYSFAAFVYEGFLQFAVVLQNNYNPRLSRLLHDDHKRELEAMIRRGRVQTYRIALLVVPALMLLYPLGVHLVFTSHPDFQDSIWPFALLMVGLLASAGFLPFQNILVMGGRPGWHTAFVTHLVLLNIMLNSLLIPRFGLPGAALSTAIALAASNLTLIYLTRRCLTVRLV